MVVRARRMVSLEGNSEGGSRGLFTFSFLIWVLLTWVCSLWKFTQLYIDYLYVHYVKNLQQQQQKNQAETECDAVGRGGVRWVPYVAGPGPGFLYVRGDTLPADRVGWVPTMAGPWRANVWTAKSKLMNLFLSSFSPSFLTLFIYSFFYYTFKTHFLSPHISQALATQS